MWTPVRLWGGVSEDIGAPLAGCHQPWESVHSASFPRAQRLTEVASRGKRDGNASMISLEGQRSGCSDLLEFSNWLRGPTKSA